MSRRRAGRTRPALAIAVTDARGRPAPARGLGAWLARAAPGGARGHVTVAIVSDRTMTRLNREFRGVDGLTDVLSFQAQGPRPKAQGKIHGPGPGAQDATEDSAHGPVALGLAPFLGDIAIARGVARRAARKQGHSEGIELRVLALHGLLHLLGYDHEADQGEMGRLEERLRRRAGLSRGLVARAPGRARHR